MSAGHPLRPHAPGQCGSLRGQAPLERRSPAKRITAGFVESAKLFRRHLRDAPLAERDGGGIFLLFHNSHGTRYRNYFSSVMLALCEMSICLRANVIDTRLKS